MIKMRCYFMRFFSFIWCKYKYTRGSVPGTTRDLKFQTQYPPPQLIYLSHLSKKKINENKETKVFKMENGIFHQVGKILSKSNIIASFVPTVFITIWTSLVEPRQVFSDSEIPYIHLHITRNLLICQRIMCVPSDSRNSVTKLKFLMFYIYSRFTINTYTLQ